MLSHASYYVLSLIEFQNEILNINEMRFLYFVLMLLIIDACSRSGKKEQLTTKEIPVQKKEMPQIVFSKLAESVFEIQTFDEERLLESGKCFLIDDQTLVTTFSMFKGATHAFITPLNGGDKIKITGYLGYDRISNLILLKAATLNVSPFKFYGGTKVKGLKTFLIAKRQTNTQHLYTGSCLDEHIIQGRKLLSISHVIGRKSIGSPILVSNGSVLGLAITEEVMYKKQAYAIPSSDILNLFSKRQAVQPITSIGKSDSKKNSTIKQVILETDYGDISIYLYNQTPAYRDNFIQLVQEGFYDSLLIHRVIRDFGIQTGAADTRSAKSDDIVGWKGPGYTIPAHIVDGLYHKRGAVGSPRKPDSKNKKRRSDGSQFYIVTGRKYLDSELDELEAKNSFHFTKEQRQVYKTIGGSPHLDGRYTVFGEVVDGINVADQISTLPVNGDFRPIKDIRLKKVEIIY
jgi:cyclophilin family peptidyl-prolyl cis-trans isomerase